MSEETYFLHDRKEILKLLEAQNHEILDWVCKRRYAYPHGYTNPRLYAAHVYAVIENFLAEFSETLDGSIKDQTLTADYMVPALLERFDFPMYFVDENLLEALMQTDLTKSMTLEELKFPFPAMMLFYPLEFTRKHFGGYLNWSILAHTGTHLQVNYPFFSRAGGRIPFVNQTFTQDNLICLYSFKESEHTPSTFSVFHPLSGTSLNSLMDLKMKDYTPGKPWNIPELQIEKFDEQKDTHRVNQFTSLAMKVLLTMTIRPDLITNSVLERPESFKKGRVREALWSPRWIGKGYKKLYEKKSQTGTHASPETHFRKGHWRDQKHGPNLELVKTIWIEPVWVNL